jgi:hypothetical protein
MGFQLKFIRERNFVLSLIGDSLTNKELEQGVQELSRETGNMHPFVELADATRLRDFSGLTENGIAFAGAMEFDRKHYKQDKVGILVASDEVYQLASRYVSTSIYFRYDAKIFWDLREALDWLGVADLEGRINEMRETG